MTAKRKVRVGIDVGGTFTDVAVVDNETREVVAQLKVPTTHHAPEGVARGIITAIQRALNELAITPADVTFIAHSTTQATNALLEGDVAQVGIIGAGRGLEGWKARLDTRLPVIELAPNRNFAPAHRFLTTPAPNAAPALATLAANTVKNLVTELQTQGAEVIVASAAFGVDDPTHEELIAQTARAQGLFATTGHEVATLYGLRTRTRTAALNAAILPKMIHTATMTETCVKQAGIAAPLMIMRSDGGVMGVDEVHRRPILTMLSGPAAGIAGALMYERVSDGIFIEVGGTSADISVIRDGQPQTKAARVGGHRTFLQTLDVRTLAIAGGSMLRENGGRLVDVGPRSAHIAGLPYAAFASDAALFDGAKLLHLQPTQYDAADYVAVECADGQRYALTPTCAANVLEIIPADAFARGNGAAARKAFEPLAQKLGVNVDEAARQVLEISCRKVAQQIEALIIEYKLERATVELVGGGGGAASLVPYTGKLLNLPARLARKAEVISTIGVALAMVRDVVERNIVDPTPDDILQIRREAAAAVIQAGALPATVEVQIAVDTRKNLVRATAFGTTELKKEDSTTGGTLDVEGCRASAARSLQVDAAQVTLCGQTTGLYVFSAPADAVQRNTGAKSKSWRRTLATLRQNSASAWEKFFPKRRQMLRVTDTTGVIRLQRAHAEAFMTTAEQLPRDLEAVINRFTDYGDAGRALPDVQILAGSRIINLAGLADAEQAIALARTELENVPPLEVLVIVAAPTHG